MGHSHVASFAHFVFSTHNREPLLPIDANRLHNYAGGILRAERCALIASGGMPDHLHLLAQLHPSASYAQLMSAVKARTSAWLRQSYPALAGFAWQSGYGAFSVSVSNVDEVKRYIENQSEQHRKMTFQEEFVAFLNRHHVPYDPAYLWK